ncbi:voltage-dependent calcium channel type D subunit alpha-1, partial [Trichonephila clavipes]
MYQINALGFLCAGVSSSFTRRGDITKPIVEERKWERYKFNFDDVAKAMLTLFTVSTFEGWPQARSLSEHRNSCLVQTRCRHRSQLGKRTDLSHVYRGAFLATREKRLGCYTWPSTPKAEDEGPPHNYRPMVAVFFIIYIIIIAFFMVVHLRRFCYRHLSERGEQEQELRIRQNQAPIVYKKVKIGLKTIRYSVLEYPPFLCAQNCQHGAPIPQGHFVLWNMEEQCLLSQLNATFGDNLGLIHRTRTQLNASHTRTVTLVRIWTEMEYRLDICRVTKEALMENLCKGTTLRNCIEFALKAKPVRRYIPKARIQYKIWWFVTSQYFEYTIFMFIMVNTTLTLAMK